MILGQAFIMTFLA